jgi:hypothetical protein
LQAFVDDRPRKRSLDSGGRFLEVVHRHPHVHVVGDVHHDPVQEEIDPLGDPQDSGALHLCLELVPLRFLPPPDVRCDVVGVDHSSDQVGEGDEGEEDRSHVQPNDSSNGVALRRADDRKYGHHPGHEGGDDPTIASDGLHPTGRILSDHHLLPPDLMGVVGAGTGPRPFETMDSPAPPSKLGELLGGGRVPHKVVALADGIGVVDAVVSEYPALVHVETRQHGEVGDCGVHPFRGEQRPVGGIVPNDEESRDDQSHGQFKSDHREHVGDDDQDGEQGHVHGGVPGKVHQSSPRRVVVDRVGKHVDHGLQTGGRGGEPHGACR